jgi:hypothetical protein
MSRKGDIREMASLVGNSAAHFALFPDDEFVRKEIETYMEMAASTAAKRKWNEREISEFKGRAQRKARSEIRRRVKEGLDQKALKGFMATAEKYIDEFIGSEMRRKE